MDPGRRSPAASPACCSRPQAILGLSRTDRIAGKALGWTHNKINSVVTEIYKKKKKS